MKYWWSCGMILFLAFCATAADGQGQYNLSTMPVENQRVQSLTLYLWVPGQHGTVTVRGIPFNVDTSVSDTWHTLIKDFEGGFAGHYENTKLPWTLIVDVMYVNLEQSRATRLGTLTINPETGIAEIAGTYTLGVSTPGCPQSTRMEVLGGLRYTAIHLGLTGATGAGRSGGKNWTEPFVGARVTQRFSPRWAGSLRGDLGGFQTGDTSDFTWNVIVTAQYNLSAQWALDAGWRWLSYNYVTGEGTSRFSYDVVLSGPFVATTYRY